MIVGTQALAQAEVSEDMRLAAEVGAWKRCHHEENGEQPNKLGA